MFFYVLWVTQISQQIIIICVLCETKEIDTDKYSSPPQSIVRSIGFLKGIRAIPIGSIPSLGVLVGNDLWTRNNDMFRGRECRRRWNAPS